MIDLTKPLELYHPQTGHVVDATFNHKECGGSVVNVQPKRDGWSCYNVSDGSPSITSNVWRLRNKVDVNLELDLTKPLYVDGVRVYLIPQKSLGAAGTIHFWQKRWDSSYGYINVTDEDGTFNRNTTFNRKNMTNADSSYDKIVGTISNNPGETKMLDLNKPLAVNGKDAKVVHTFPSGKLAVVVEGYGEIQHFDADGTRPFGGVALVNKVVETVRYVNVYPGGNTRGGSTHTHTSLSAAIDGIGQQRKTAGAVMVKQTLIDGKVVKSELVD
jgi:hypothetical protein